MRREAAPGAFGSRAQPESDSRKLETETAKKPRRSGSRGSGLNRRTVREINANAEERLAARLAPEPHPNTEYRTTKRLGELFEERRDETAGTLTEPFCGATMRAGRGQ